MNRIYRLIWSECLEAFVPAAELTRRRGKRSGRARALAAALLVGAVGLSPDGATAANLASALKPVYAPGAKKPVAIPEKILPKYSTPTTTTTTTALPLSPVTATELPTGSQVTAGQATVTSSGDRMTVTEGTPTAAIDWNTFNIGSEAGVTFVQPSSSSVILNRVLSADPSQIFGSLNANGIVFLINAQGVVVGKGAEVNVGGLVASTLNLSDKDLLASNWAFTGSSSGTVSNAGSIHVTPGGFAALLGSRVENTGSIAAKLGSVALASGNQVTLDFDEAGLLKVAISQSALNALVSNAGAILADGGRIILTAKSADQVLGAVVNNSGVLQAQSIGMRDGQVWLLAADELANTGANGATANGSQVQGAAGGVLSSGTIDVSGQTGAAAGEATLAGTTATLTGGIDAHGAVGNAGRVLINSTQATTLGANSAIDVSSAGSAGKLVAWSDGDTNAYGAVDGRGIGASGVGATVEVSSAHGLGFGANVELTAANSAKAGTLMLDPATLEIASGSGMAPGTVYQSVLQNQSGNIVLSATGQITVDALTNNVLDLANASSLSITSQSSGGIAFLNNGGGTPSGITTHGAPISLTASGSGALDNIGVLKSNGGDINLSGVFVHLAGGLDATNGANAAGNVGISVFGGAILSSSSSPIAGGQVTLDATYGYVGSAGAPVPTATGDLIVKTGGNVYVANTGSLSTLDLTSNHLEGTPVGIGITAANLQLTGADAIGDNTLYSNAVRWTDYSASNPGNLTGPSALMITEDNNLLPGNINLPQTALTLTSKQGYILGGNAQPVIASTLTLASSLGIGGTDFNGVNAETDQGVPGSTLLTRAGLITVNVLDPSGNITGIVNLTQQGDLFGSVQANRVLLQATGNIGSALNPFALSTGWYGEVYNAAAGADLNLNTQFTGQQVFDSVQAGGNLSVQVTTPNGWYVSVGQATAGGDLSLTGTNFGTLHVSSAASTNGSIAITNDQTLQVDEATLNGTDAVNRSIDLTSNFSQVAFGLISTNGPTGAAAASAPLGSITINALQGSIYDLAAWEDPPPSVLRAATATLNSLNGIYINNTGVDTYTNLTLNAGMPGSGSGNINASLVGIDSVNDFNGNSSHAIHLNGATTHGGDVNITNRNGDLQIGSVRASYDYSGEGQYAANIYLTATGSIVADGSVGGGRINAADGNGNGGFLSLNAETGSLGTRGTGPDGTIGATYLSLSGSSFDLYTHGDLFANNDQSQISQLNLNLGYRFSDTPFFYHFTSANAADILANTPGITFNAGSSGGFLTVTSATIANSAGNVQLAGDNDIRVQSWQAGNNVSLAIYGGNIAIDAPADNTPALSMGDSSSLYVQAYGNLTVGNIASTGTNPGDSSVGLSSYNGSITLGVVNAANANVSVYTNSGDILGSAGNQTLAHDLTLNNSVGAIGADPTVAGSIPITIGVANNLTLTNEGGGGSINLVTLNDPASLNLTLYTPNSQSYGGANYSMAPATTGLGFSGSANSSGVTLATLGTTGTNAAAVPVSITTDSPSITINSGTGPQLGIGYDLYFGNSYSSLATNLSGSAGQNVIVHLDDNVSQSLSSLTGNIALTNLQIDENLYSWHAPLTVNFTLTQPLTALTLVRTGGDYDPTSFHGSSVSLSGSGQTFSAVETSGTNNGAPGVMTLNGTSATALDLTVNLSTAGIMDVGTINLGALGAVNLSTHIGSRLFTGIASAIEGVDGNNSITAASVNLSATGNYAHQATLGTSTVALNVNAPAVALTSSGDTYLNTGGTLTDLAVTVWHPYRDVNRAYNATSENYVYQIAGSTSLTATDDAANTATALSFSSAAPVNFSFTTDRTIDVGTINAGAAGTVTLNANGSWRRSPYYNYTHIGIEQGAGSGITAGTVSLNANGYQGHVGTDATALEVDTANLSVNVNAGFNVADSAALNSLSLTLSHSYDYQTGWNDHGYAVTAPNIAFTLTDLQQNGYGMVALQNLVSSTLQSFSLTLNDSNLGIGNFGGDFTGGQISLGSSATVNLTSTNNSIWAQSGGGGYTLSDTASSAVADNAVAVKVGTLNLSAAGNVTFSTYGCNAVACDALPVEVNNLSVKANGSSYVQNVGDLNVVSANIAGSGYFRAVEAAPSTSASITGGSLATPLTAGDLTLVTFYGDIGTSAAPVITNTSTLTLQSGADIYAANQQELATLSIVSHHNKGSIGDTSNGGLNTLVVTDTNAAGPLQLGVTDLGVNGGGYQLEGANAPQLNFSFQTDTAISVGALSGNSITLISENDNILHLPESGIITAGSVSLSAYTPGKSVGAAGADILIDSPNVSVSTGGNMYVADSATLDSLSFTIGAVTSLGNNTPVYHLDNSGAANPLHFDVTGDIVNNVLDINSITVSRTDAPVAISVYTPSSGIGVTEISDALVGGGTVNVWSDSSGNVFGLGSTPAGISASTVSLIARGGNIGTDTNGAAAPVIVAADTVSALSSGDIRLTSARTISDLSLEQWNANPAAGAVWAVTTPDFALQGVVTGNSTLDLGTVTGATTNLNVNSAAELTIGTLNLGSASLNLNAWTNNGARSIESDGTNGSTANITTTGDVALHAYHGIGDTTQITTDVGGAVSLTNWYLGIDVAQISNKDLNLSALSECGYCGPSPITITSVGNMTLTNGLGAGSGSGSPVTLTAGGDINYLNTLNINGGSITLSAGGSIAGGDIWNSGSASLTAAGTATNSPGSISIGNINGVYWDAVPGAITLHAVGDVNLAGELVSANSVSITSTAGGIYGTAYGTFSVTPNITLNAYVDIGSGSNGDLGQWAINNGYQNNPGSVTVSAQAGGRINLLSYAAVVAPVLSGGGDVSLQVLGDNWHQSNTGVSFGTISSTNGSVYLGTQQGDIMGSGGGSGITAGNAITLDAQQNNYFRDTNNAITTPFKLGTSAAPLSLTAPQINLTANGEIYATVPTTGLTDLSVARTYVAYASYNTPPDQQATSMPAGTVLIKDVAADTVLDVVDGGWASGNLSAISASYGTALNLSYAGNNAIQLGAITLNGGNLALQATSPSNISITSTGALIQANNFSFNLIDANGLDGTPGTATGGFGTLANPINTQITSLSGTTVGATAGVFMNQTGGITFTNLTTGGDIAVTTTRVIGAQTANADIAIGNVTSNGGSVHFTADGAIVAAMGVDSPSVTAHGSSNDGGVTLAAAAGVNLPSSNLSSDYGDVTISATTGGVALNSGTLNAYNGALTVSATAGGVAMTSSSLYANGNIDITATAGGIEMASSQVDSGNGNITVHALDTGLDLAASFVQAGSGAATIALTADQGDVTFGSINTAGNVAVTATTGAINGTSAAHNLTGQYNGISASNIALNAATGIGTAAIPVSLTTSNGNATIANTTGVGADVYLVTGSQNPGGQAIFDGTIGGALNVANYYNTLTLDAVQTQGDINVTQQNYYGNILLNNVAATGPGATFSFVAPYGNISSTSTAGSVSASRIVLNALGDPSGGTLGQNIAPVNVDADVVIAVASGNIALNSLATGVSKMPLVASNGDTPTVSITAAGDFQVGQVVAGTQGTVNITSAGNILDDGDNTTQIYAGTVNLSAAGAIGTALTPISTTAIAYDEFGNVAPGVITAASTTSGNIYLVQTGDAILQSLTAANGSINVTINDPAHGQSTLMFADTTPTDAAGNDINVTINGGDLTVDVAQAGMTAGTVNLNATAGSLYGDGRADCCINPNASGNTVTLNAQNNIGAVSDVNLFAGTALGIQANQSTATTTADASQIYIQYVGNATVGTGVSVANRLNPLGLNAQVLLAACGDLTLAGLSLPGANLGLLAGTGGNGGSVLDGINGGASLATPDVTAASISFGASNNVGDVADSLWVNTPVLSAQAANGGVWINNAATSPVSVPLIVAGNGPVVLGGQGDLLIGTVYATGSAALTSVTGAVLDGRTSGANADHPNLIAASVTVTSATNGGSASDALWVDSPSITASAASGGFWINDAATGPVTVASVTTNGGPIVVGSQGDLAVVAVNAGSGSATLNSATGAVVDGIGGGSNAANPNVIAGTVTVNSAVDTGNASDALWVNAANIGATANGGGVWINDAATTPVTATSITAGNGTVVIGAQGNLLVDTINAGSGSATLTSAAGGVLDGVTGGSNANNPNVIASAVTVNSAVNAGNASDALWVNAAVITGSAATGGVWINDASTAPVTVSSVTTNGAAVVIGSQGELAVVAVNAGSGSATLNSATGAVIDGITGGSNAANPNVIAGSVTVNSAIDAGNPADALWVNAAVISGSATTGGVWINDAATTPVTVTSITGNGPVVINAQANLLIDSINAGSGSATLTSATGGVLDGVTGGSNAGHPNVTASAVTVNSAVNAGNASDALWVNAAVISGSATTGGVWINDVSTSPVTVASVTTNGGPVVIGSQGELAVVAVNAGSGSATLNSATGAVVDGITGGSSAANPNVIAGSVSVNSAIDAGNASDALWVNAAVISGSANTGGVWINDASTAPVTVSSVTTHGGAVVIGSQGELAVVMVNAGSGSATLNSATGAVVDGITGGSNAANPNVIAGTVNVNSAIDAGNSSDALWVNASNIGATANGGGVWINDAATTPVTLTSITAGNGPVVINSQGNMLVDSVNAGSSSATLSSSAGSVLDGIHGGSSASRPNVTASSVTVNSAANGGNANDALWVDAATISGTATNGGVWINDAAATPVNVTSITAGNGAVVIGSQGDLLIDSVNAGKNSATLISVNGSVLDGIEGGSSAAYPNVTAGSVTVNSGANGGNASDALWVNAAAINAAVTSGGVWINDAATTPVKVSASTANNGPVVIGTAGDMLVGRIAAGTGDVTLDSGSGAILDGIRGGSSTRNPNITGGTVTLTAQRGVGTTTDRVYINGVSIDVSGVTGDLFINAPPTPYPGLPLVDGVSPVTVYAAYAQAQVQPAQQLPITLIGKPLRMAPPIEVTADLFGISLPSGVDADAAQQDNSMDTASKPIFGGNDEEVGRKKALLKLKKKAPRESKRESNKQTQWKG